MTPPANSRGFTLVDCASTARNGAARSGHYQTAHGAFETPAFMPVGTQGTVKAISPRELRELGAQIVLSNTYHLHVRPGEQLIEQLGGLHKFMGWDGPILTDSGGFQVFSLSGLRKVTDDGVTFQSHVDGRKIEFTPERVVEIQEALGVDIMMILDVCPPYPADQQTLVQAVERTSAWAVRARNAPRRTNNSMFGIVQGGMDFELRKRSAEELRALDFDGYALGGFSVGEPPPLMWELVQSCAELLPREKPRYLMGVGTPEDLVRSVSNGIDMFDCVIPTRSARFGRVYVGKGHINLRNSKFRTDPQPILPGCDCEACQGFSRAYISHLIHSGEILGIRLATIHNLRFYQRLMSDMRIAISNGDFLDFARAFLSTPNSGE